MSHPINSIILENQAEELQADKDWNEHRELHLGHPSANCHYCQQDADEVREEMEMEAV
jgi:hypothetical protein